MGKATIVSGGASGTYQIKMDFGKAERDKRVAQLSLEKASYIAEITRLSDLLETQEATEDAARVTTEAAIAAYVAAVAALAPALQAIDDAQAALAAAEQASYPSPEDQSSTIATAKALLAGAKAAYTAAEKAIKTTLEAHTKALTALVAQKQATAVLRVELSVPEGAQVALIKEIARLQALLLEETRQAWCADLTETATGEVATIEIPGEDKRVLIAPEAPAPVAADGALSAREMQSPEQLFWNAAVLPGWQKYKPTYRRGTITAINAAADTADVLLEATDKSSAQNLVINQTPTLTGVPVFYMSCNTGAFEVGDRAVIKFTDQDWAKPRVVGFVDNPKPCGVRFTCIPATPTDQFGYTSPLSLPGTGPINGGKGIAASIGGRSFSGVHVPTRATAEGVVTFAPAQIKRAQQNTPDPSSLDQNVFYNSYLAEHTQYTNPAYAGYSYATPSLASSLHAINREWVSADLKTCVSTAFGDVRVSGQKKGSPTTSRDQLIWACIMDKATPTPADPAAKTKYLCAWTWFAPYIEVYTRPLAGDAATAWTLVASKDVTNYNPLAMDGTAFAAQPQVEEFHPSACWLRKGARNAAGNVCSMWVQNPRYWRVVSQSRAAMYAWLLDFDINAATLTSSAMPTETVTKGGTTDAFGSMATTFYSQTGTRHIDFEYTGNTKTFTSLVFTGGYTAAAGGTYAGDLKTMLTKGAFSLKVWEENYTGGPGSYATDSTRTDLYHYGNGALSYSTTVRALSSTYSTGSLQHTRAMKFALVDRAAPLTLDLLPTETIVHAGSVINMSDQPNYVYNADAYSGPGGIDTIGAATLLTNRLEYRRYKGLNAFAIDRSMLNFRVLGSAYLLCLPKISYGPDVVPQLVLNTDEYTVYCSDPALLASFALPFPSGVLKHIMLV